MAKLPSSELRAILASARSSALGADTASTLADERTKALNYYYGDMSEDLPSATGRSSAVSTDVSDTVEGLMPSLMEIFAGGDEVVKFEAVGPEDVEAADQETDFVNHVFLQKNSGFLILYNFIKDALLSKNGFVKVFWEDREEEERETYFDQPDDAFAIIAQAAQSGDIEIIEHTARDAEGYPPDASGHVPQLHDVTILTTKKYECAKVEGVPPEEVGISRNSRCIPESDYFFHETIKPESARIDEGFDPKQLKTIPSHGSADNSEALARDTVEESPVGKQGDEGINHAARLIKVTEHYIRLDYEQDGKPRLYRITTGGEQAEVLTREGKPDIEPVDMIPFASMTPIIVPHRFFGRSIADCVMDIQRIKTALLRGLLDNTYLGNNPRPEIAESHASENTLDDLLVSRFGAPVRVKAPGGLFWNQVPSNAASIYPALEYFDQVREQRTGVAKQGQALDSKALLDQSATAANLAFTSAQARMKLIARIMAETGIRELFSLLHATIRKHGSKAQTVRLRNKWVEVDPRDWKARNDMTINVGLGTGGKAEQLQMMSLIGSAQEKMLAGGMSHIVQPKNLYNAAKALTKIVGEKDPNTFFSDPDEKDQNGKPVNPPPAPTPDPKLVELQAKNEIEKTQAQADIATQDRKTQAEIVLAEKKFELERELKLIDAQLSVRKHEMEMQGRQADQQAKAQDHAAKAEEASRPKASIEVRHGADELTGPLAEAIAAFGQHVATTQAQHTQALMEAINRAGAPKRIVRDPKTNRAIGVETVQ